MQAPNHRPACVWNGKSSSVEHSSKWRHLRSVPYCIPSPTQTLFIQPFLSWRCCLTRPAPLTYIQVPFTTYYTFNVSDSKHVNKVLNIEWCWFYVVSVSHTSRLWCFWASSSADVVKSLNCRFLLSKSTSASSSHFLLIPAWRFVVIRPILNQLGQLSRRQ